MKVWRVHLRPSYEDIDPVDICIKQGIVGIGWRVSRRPKDIEDYIGLCKQEHKDNGWYRAINALVNRMSIGDLVWIRDFFGMYYIGQIKGEWQYLDTIDNIKADIINVRSCNLFRVGTNIAGKIVNCFRPAATIQQIKDETSALYSVLTYNQLSGSNIEFPKYEHTDIFSLLSDVDIEDIVGLYLQEIYGFLVVPSSRSKYNNTISYEFQLIDPHTNEPVFVQVKSGKTQLDPKKYYNFPYTYYLFSPAGYIENSSHKNIVCISVDKIRAYLNKRKSMMPNNISTWLNLQSKI